MAKQTVKYAYIKSSSIAPKLENKTIDAYDIVITKDTHELIFITEELSSLKIHSRVYTYESIEEANRDVNERVDAYEGEIVAIDFNGKYRAYIVNKDGENFKVSSIIEGQSYDDLEDKPIVNLTGTLENPVIISDLPSGTYSVKGQYKISENDITVNLIMSPQMFYISHEENEITITHMTKKGIYKYVIANEETTLDNYLTTTDIKSMTASDEAIRGLF